MLVKVIHAGSAATSFAAASADLSVLAEAEISDKRIGRIVKRIGNERVAEVQQQAAAYEDLPLPARQQSPVDLTPSLVCVQCDGGRLQIRNRTKQDDQSDEAKDDSKSSFWRESKVGALIKMTGATHDPCPEIPTVFVDAERMSRLTREIKGFSGDKGESAEATSQSSAEDSESLLKPDELHVSTRPKPLVRSVIATTENIQAFGKLLVVAAHARGFMAAERRAFVCDGMACNWTLHEKHFGRFTPILDIVHAICYLYHAAIGGDPTPESWQRYCQWAQWLWSGEVDKLLASMHAHQAKIGLPEEADKDTSARALLADAIRYVSNQRSRMDYARYRQQGLPITSAYIESTIKQINRRVKGTEKFWSINANPMLQLRADFTLFQRTSRWRTSGKGESANSAHGANTKWPHDYKPRLTPKRWPSTDHGLTVRPARYQNKSELKFKNNYAFSRANLFSLSRTTEGFYDTDATEAKVDSVWIDCIMRVLPVPQRRCAAGLCVKIMFCDR